MFFSQMKIDSNVFLFLLGERRYLVTELQGVYVQTPRVHIVTYGLRKTSIIFKQNLYKKEIDSVNMINDLMVTSLCTFVLSININSLEWNINYPTVYS